MDAHPKKAFVLGAGLGTRLRPLTLVRPKPLMPIFGKPLITFALDHLRSVGIESFVINTHHLPEQFDALFQSGEYAGAPVKLVYEPALLETGGGIKNAEPWIGGGTFIVYSGDILTDIDVAALVGEHLRMKNDVTLALRNTGLATGVAFADGRVVDIGGKLGHPGQFDFANVSVWNAGIFSRIPAGRKISFVPVLVEWIAQGGSIGGLVLDDRQWFNIGSRAEYLAVHKFIGEKFWKPAYVDMLDWPARVGAGANLDPTATVSASTVVGAGARVGSGAVLENCILWNDAEIASGARLRDCIVTTNRRVEGSHTGEDI
ncbi:MAG TPA: sugar phosphate nucleotidyltransferase [Chthoniobacteraceae bacterium]|nr:sugar phosphate nucleotidyltransferase [Chthoniobacteraceae bacterium]